MRSRKSSRNFLPTTADDLRRRGWDQLDVLLISGDAYVDHPAFGASLIGRWLEHHGYRVGMIAQPRWDSPVDVRRLGRPRLFVGVSAGNLDSMLNKLTAQKKVRSVDDYSPGGKIGLRPNRATVVYSNICRQAFPGIPIVLGGIEASLRRIAHYDYWADSLRRSVLLDAKAHLLLFGMAERAVVEVARHLAAGNPIDSLTQLPGTAHGIPNRAGWEEMALNPSKNVRDGRVVLLPSYEEVCADKAAFALMTKLAQGELNPFNARPLLQPHGKQAVYINPPARPLSTEQLDRVYSLPYCRAPHPSYRLPVPAFASIRRSLSVVRGCFGGCAFCSISEHEGRIVQSRSKSSVLREARELAKTPSFDGTLSDVGGPTANTYAMGCKSETIQSACRRPSCLHPKICSNLNTDHTPLMKLLAALRREPKLRHVFVNSGIRYDLAERSPEFIRDVARFHTSGQLSVAPEHTQTRVLRIMRKPSIQCYERFAKTFYEQSERAGKKQFLIPYLIVGHPGATLSDTIELAFYLKRNNLRPRQIQEFIPTPMSVATAMYYTGLDPQTREPVQVERNLRAKRGMKALLLWWDREKWPMAREALKKAGRADLIGKLIPADSKPDHKTDRRKPMRRRRG